MDLFLKCEINRIERSFTASEITERSNHLASFDNRIEDEGKRLSTLRKGKRRPLPEKESVFIGR